MNIAKKIINIVFIIWMNAEAMELSIKFVDQNSIVPFRTKNSNFNPNCISSCLTYTNSSEAYCVKGLKDGDEKVVSLNHIKGVINNAQGYIFLNTALPDVLEKFQSGLNDTIKNGYGLPRLSISNLPGLKIKSNSGYRGDDSYNPKHALAYVESYLELGNSNTVILPFCLARSVKDSKIHMIVSKLYHPEIASSSTFFYSDDKISKDNNVVDLVNIPIEVKNGNPKSLARAGFYLSKKINAKQYHAFIFLHFYNDNETSGDIKELSIMRLKEKVELFEHINYVFVSDQLHKQFGLSTKDKNVFLQDIFYALYKEQVASSNKIILDRSSMQNADVSTSIAITDHQCFETENGIRTWIFVKMLIAAKMTGISVPIGEYPLYVLLKTDLPFEAAESKLEWTMDLFLPHKNNKSKDNLYFMPNLQAMDGNELRHVLLQEIKSVEIKSLADDNIELLPIADLIYDDKGSLCMQGYTSYLSLPATNLPENNAFTQDDEYDERLTKNEILLKPEIANENLVSLLEESKNDLGSFAKILVTQVEELKTYSNAFFEQVNKLTNQHNSFFARKKELEKQEGVVQELLETVKNGFADLANQQKEDISKSINNLSAENEKLNTVLKEEQVNSISQAKEDIVKENKDILKSLLNQSEKELKQNEERLKMYQKTINEKMETLEEKIQEFNTTLSSNVENLKQVEGFNETLRTIEDSRKVINSGLEGLRDGYAYLNVKILAINTRIDTINNAVDVYFINQKDYNTDNSKNIAKLQINNRHLTFGLMGVSVVAVGFAAFFYWYMQCMQARIALLEARLV